MKKIFLFAFLLIQSSVNAQTGEARLHLPSPTGKWQAEMKYMNIDQNLLVFGNRYMPGYRAKADVFPVTLTHTFAIGDGWAKVSAMAARVTSFTASTSRGYTPVRYSSTKGFSDGYVAFEIGFLNNKAKSLPEFSQTAPEKISANALFRFWYSDKRSYSSFDQVNISSNRMTFEFGIPVQVRLNNDTDKILWLETCPGIQFYTANDDVRYGKLNQKPMFYMENHLSYNLNTKLYGGLSLTYKQGGQTYNEGLYEGLTVWGDNMISIVTGGAFVGYKILPSLEFKANYGGLLLGESRVMYEVVELGLVFSYFNERSREE